MKTYEKIRIIRKQNHWTQNQLANKLGVSRQAISKWESGVVFPSQENLIRICEVFKIQLEELINDDVPVEVKPDKKSNNFISIFLFIIISCFAIYILKEPASYKLMVSNSLEELTDYEKVDFSVYKAEPVTHVSMNRLFMKKERKKIFIELRFDNEVPIYLNFHDSKRKIQIITDLVIPANSRFYVIELDEEIYRQMDDLLIDVRTKNRSTSTEKKSNDMVTLCKIRVSEVDFYKMKVKSKE